MIETCCQFGPQQELAGIITEPDAIHAGTGLILINAGLVPKHGPYRLYAELARHLAQQGVRTLRFDLGDIGDSRPAHPGCALEERTRHEVSAAIEQLCDDRTPPNIVLGGLCSGAEDAFRCAETDARVSHLILIDPFSFETPGWHWHDRLYRLARSVLLGLGLHRSGGNLLARWTRNASPTNATAGLPGGSEKASAEEQSADASSRLNYKHMGRPQASRILKTLIARGVHVHFIYTGGMRPGFNHAGQLAEMFSDIDFRGQVSLDYFPRLDHMQPLRAERNRLVETISRRLKRTSVSTARSTRKGATEKLVGSFQSSAI